ncbi:unnamed protein product [Rotaria sp. Silwood2]|nr:unnamed protein product [Rotaria sp. Silwood2]CAF3343462.1 unnamed protein product [Rotaria sp. Silwood2]CAF4198855.1 unnamed protein product [Rotaria sp. Silwood2]CAF4278924.1 unnamed protein product [Rotaria sp. Silwood2]
MSNFSSSLRAIILDNSCASLAFYKHWTQATTSPIYLTPSIKRLIVMETEYFDSFIVHNLIKPLFGNTLPNLHLIFEYPNGDVQYSFELVLILKNGVIPLLQHLNVTIEQEQFEKQYDLEKSPPSNQLRECDIRQMNYDTQLQTLVLRHLAFSQLVILLNSIRMPLLKK